MCKPTQEMSILEVGAFAGDATVVFCQHFKKVRVVDPWKSGIGDITDKVSMANVFDYFLEKTEKYIGKKLTFRILTFWDYFKRYRHNMPSKCDIVYLDALHTYEAVKDDIKIAKYFIVPGGILAGHDYTEEPYKGKKFPGVVQAVDEIGGPDCVFSDSSWIKHM